MPTDTAPATVEVRGLADRLGLDDDGSFGDAVYEALADAAVAAIASVMPTGWLYRAIPSEVRVNTMAMAEGVLLGVFDAMPDTLDGFVDRYGTLLARSAWVGSGLILFTDGWDLIAGMGEGIVEEFTDLWKIITALFEESTWTTARDYAERAVQLLCGSRDRALAVGWQIGQSIAGAVSKVVFGPRDQFARALGKLVGPILAEIAIGLLTGGAGLAAAIAKYGVKGGRYTLKIGAATLDLIADAAKGLKRLPDPPKQLDDLLLHHATDTPPMSMLPEPDPGLGHTPLGADLSTNDLPMSSIVDDVDRGLANPPDRTPTSSVDDAVDHSLDDTIPDRPVARRDSPSPTTPPEHQPDVFVNPRRQLSRDQLDRIAAAARDRAGKEGAAPFEKIEKAVQAAAQRWHKLDIDDPDTLDELADLMSKTLRRETRKGDAPLTIHRVGAAGELRALNLINDQPEVDMFRLLTPRGQRTPDIEVSFQSGAIGNFDLEIRSYTQAATTSHTKPSGKVVRKPARDPRAGSTGSERVMPGKTAFDPDRVVDAFIGKMRHGQLRGPGRPQRGVIAVNLRRTPRPDLLDADQVQRLLDEMTKWPEVEELWLIGPGGIQVVAARADATISTALGLR